MKVQTHGDSSSASTDASVSTRHRYYGQRGLRLVRGQGCHVWDESGNRYLDATSMFGVALLGHAHPAVTAAITTQAQQLIACMASFEPPNRTAYFERLARHFPPGFEFFAGNSGTEAVETALKAARATTGRTSIVAANRGFHGRTLGALSATHKASHREAFAPLVPGFRHVPYNNPRALRRALEEPTAAVILEAVQGEGGVHPAEVEFLQEVQHLCRDRGALLILDEVQTGFGRTGHWFGFQHAGIEPDIVCLAKGIANGVPMGLTALGPRVSPFRPGSHGSTFGANPLACAAASATLQELERGAWPTQAAEIGSRWLECLRSLPSDRIRDVRGRGLMLGIELRVPVAPIVRALQQRGILSLSAGRSVLRLLPPLVIEWEHCEQITATLAEVLES